MTSDKLHETTREYYNRLIAGLPEDYIDFRWNAGPVQRSHYRHTRVAILKAFEEIGHVRSLLEVGPGPGTWSDLCLAHADHVTLCDISSEMLAKARRRLGDGIRYVEGDFVGHDTLLDGTYEAVVSFRALEYMANKATFVKRAHQYVAPGGALVVVTKNPGWRDKPVDEETREIYRHWIEWPDLARMMREEGFEGVRVFPVAVGSYNRPFNNVVGVGVANLWQRWISGKPMKEGWNALVESYLVIGRRKVPDASTT